MATHSRRTAAIDLIRVAVYTSFHHFWLLDRQGTRQCPRCRRPCPLGLPPRWPSGKAYASRAADLCSIPVFTVELFPGRDISVTSNLVLEWLPCLAPDSIVSSLRLVGSVSAYCDWVRSLICNFYLNVAASTTV